MMDVMLHGKIECECGNIYYFDSMREEILCVKCGKMNPNKGEPRPPEPTEEELTETDI